MCPEMVYNSCSSYVAVETFLKLTDGNVLQAAHKTNVFK